MPYCVGTNRPSQWAGSPCPECGAPFLSEAAMAVHRARMHAKHMYSARPERDRVKKKVLDPKAGA